MRASRSELGPKMAKWWIVGLSALTVAAAIAAPAVPTHAQSSTATGSPSPTATPALYLFQDNDPYMVYSGTDWNVVQDPRAQGGTLHQARVAGTLFRMEFTGSYFKWFGVKGPNRGRARVSVDGVEVSGGIIDLYKAGDPSYDVIVWAGGLDSERRHTLVIEVLGQRNGASTDALVAIDAVEVATAERAPSVFTATPTPSPSQTPTPGMTPSPSPSPTGSPAGTATATGTTGASGDRAAGSWPIDSRFLRFYVEYDGLRILGNTVSPPTFFAGYFTQYFEKGRIEDHTGESPDPNWQFLYGLLVDEMQTARAQIPIGGEASTLSYGPSPSSLINVYDQALEERREAPPPGFTGDTMTRNDGSVFVPYSQALRPGPGHYVSPIFWPYINRRDIFPGGWLHDVGLPMTEPITAVVTKGTMANRNILVQVFQRTILTYDPLNPTDFQVERANVGSDYRRAFPDRVPQ